MSFNFDSDHLDSDDMEAVLEMTRNETSSSSRAPTTILQPQGHLQDMKSRLASIDDEISRVDREIEKQKELREQLSKEKQVILDEIHTSRNHRPQERKGKGKAANTINYMTEPFDWTGNLKRRMKKVFGIDEFRHCQQGVCNANLEGRDIICVMPTGGGKSLTYQLPALFSPGCTLVISPLLALMTDQILHLREAKVEAVMLCGSTSRTESNDIFSRLTNPPANPEHGIKLCYVTPEKIANSVSFLSLLSKMYQANRLARIVIDEAHCVSSMGHDFRPDYKKLSKLRHLYPTVPILALSATCPPKVLNDLLKILRLKECTKGDEAEEGKTVYFSAPLYRKNLHYSIIRKPSADKDVISAMSSYILTKHADHSGIVYCFSKADTEHVAEGLRTASGGKIKTGVYHSKVNDSEKTQLHERWRRGDIKVVCATIAFGLGIDKGDVRFVLHHSMSKSLEGYYQESGRAGRDGKDADCVLWYRPQDASRLSSQAHETPGGAEKVHEMLNFAQDLENCRKIAFAKHFSSSTNLSLSSWSTEDSNVLDNCGHCDNCSRSTDTFVTKDMTLEAWRILKVAEEIHRNRARATLASLASLVKGSGSVDVGRGKNKEKMHLDLDEICGGKTELSKEDAETLIVQLIIKGCLTEQIVQTAYKSQVYLEPTILASRMTAQSKNDVQTGKNTTKVTCSFSVKSRKSKAKPPKASKSKDIALSFTKSANKRRDSGSKRKRDEVDVIDSEEERSEDDNLYAGDDDFIVPEEPAKGSGTLPSSGDVEEYNSSEDEEREYGWSNSLLADPRPLKKTRTVVEEVKDDDVIYVSD